TRPSGRAAAGGSLPTPNAPNSERPASISTTASTASTPVAVGTVRPRRFVRSMAGARNRSCPALTTSRAASTPTTTPSRTITRDSLGERRDGLRRAFAVAVVPDGPVRDLLERDDRGQ